MRGLRLFGLAVVPMSELTNQLLTTIDEVSAKSMGAGVNAVCEVFEQAMFDPQMNNEQKLLLLQTMSADLREQAERMSRTGEVRVCTPEEKERQKSKVADLAEIFVKMKELDEQ